MAKRKLHGISNTLLSRKRWNVLPWSIRKTILKILINNFGFQIWNSKKCRNFIVRADNFEIEYVCKNHVFGVRKVNESYRAVDPSVVDARLDNFQYYAQKVISQNPKNEEELLGLIACYLPSLIKEQYRNQIWFFCYSDFLMSSGLMIRRLFLWGSVATT